MQEYKRIDISKDQLVQVAFGAISASAARGADRELNALFAVEFEGLDTSKRLFLPEDMLETQGKGQIMVTPLSELVEKNLGGDGKWAILFPSAPTILPWKSLSTPSSIPRGK